MTGWKISLYLLNLEYMNGWGYSLGKEGDHIFIFQLLNWFCRNRSFEMLSYYAIWEMLQSAWTALTASHRLGGLHRNLLFHRPGGQKSKVKVLSEPFWWRFSVTFSLCPYGLFSECAWWMRDLWCLSLLTGTPVEQDQGSTLIISFNLNHFPKALSPNTVALGVWLSTSQFVRRHSSFHHRRWKMPFCLHYKLREPVAVC